MKRSRPITDIIIESLSLNTFSIECTSIILTQQTTVDTQIRYSGPGLISKGDAEEFTIKFYSSVPENLRGLPVRFSEVITDSHITEKIIQSSEYFKMEALSHAGETWIAENIWLTGDINHNTYGMILSGSTKSIKSSTKSKRDRHILNMTCLHQGFRFPCNSWTEDRIGQLQNKSEFEIDSIQCTITIYDCNLNIILTTETLFPDDFDRAFLNALQIATGKQLKLIHRLYADPNECVVTLSAESNSAPFSSLCCPLPNQASPWNLPAFTELLTKLIRKLIAENTPNFLQYFLEMFTAYKSGVQASALGFSVAVEGMACHYFKKYGMPEPGVVEKCFAAIPFLHKAESDGLIERDVRDNLVEHLKEAGAPCVKNILYKLFDKITVDQWIDIRYPAAYGILLDKDLTAQKLISCARTCIYMYYAMVFAHVDFRGGIRNFSLPNDPETDNEVLKSIEKIERAF